MKKTKIKIKITKKDIISMLGIESENVKNYNQRLLKKEFNSLIKKYDQEQIWLKEDYGVYVEGEILVETKLLYAINC